MPESTVTREMIEAAAAAIANARAGRRGMPPVENVLEMLGRLMPNLLHEVREDAEAALKAAFAVTPPSGDGWEPIETADPPLEDVTADLPDGAQGGLGWAVCDISGEFAYHTWWVYEGGGVSRVTHWRRPIAGPASALATREGARG